MTTKGTFRDLVTIKVTADSAYIERWQFEKLIFFNILDYNKV